MTSIACRTLDSARKLCQGIKHAKPISLDVTNSSALDAEVKKVDVVVSLIPFTYHTTVIKSAIREKKNVVTTSQDPLMTDLPDCADLCLGYISPAILELEKDVKEAGITVMNEIGLDPGIDHLYGGYILDIRHLVEANLYFHPAVKMIDEVHKAGGKVTGFWSYWFALR